MSPYSTVSFSQLALIGSGAESYQGCMVVELVVLVGLMLRIVSVAG